MKLEKEIFPAATDSRFLREVTFIFPPLSYSTFIYFFFLKVSLTREGFSGEGVISVKCEFFCVE